MNKFFLRLFDFFKTRKVLLFSLVTTLIVLLTVSALNMNFNEDISGFLPKDKQNEQINYAYTHIGASNTIIVYFSMRDSLADGIDVIPEAIEYFINTLNNNDINKYSKKIQYTVDESAIIEKMNFLSKNIPYFLDRTDYERIDSIIIKENIIKQLGYDRNILGSIQGSIMKGVISNDPLLISSELLAGLNSFRMNEQFTVSDGYIYTADGKEAIVRIESGFPLSETANNKVLINIIDKSAKDTEDIYNDVTVKPFGAAYISVGNADQIKHDSIVTVSIAIIFIVIILFYSFRSLKIIISLPLTICFAMLFALGITSLVYHEVSLIAIGISSVIIGIAANYPLHFLDHKYHLYSTRQTINDIIEPLTIGNITTVGAFLSLLFISSPAMKNLGLFSALLLAGAILFVLIVIPHIVPENHKCYSKNPKRLFKRFTNISFENYKPLIFIIFVLTIIFLFFDKAKFDADMSKINYMTDEQRVMMQKLTKDTEDSDMSLFIVAEGNDINSALCEYESIYNDLQELTTTHKDIRLTSIGSYIPSKEKQKERLALWKEYWNDKNIYPIIEEAAVQQGFKKDAFTGFKQLIDKDYEVKDMDYFAPLYDDLAENYILNEADRAMVFSVLHVKPEQCAAIMDSLKNDTRFSSDKVFLFNQQSIMTQIIESLSEDFDLVLFICSCIVFFFLWLSFGRIELTLLSFLPLAISWIWILALMPVFNMQFNIVNIILATFIFGMGDDYTIFMTEGCMYEFRYGKKMLSTYKSTVALSALIMFIGIGVLILAKHPAMRQLGEVVILGMFAVVMTAFVIPPFFFKWLTTKKGVARKNPITLKNLSLTVYSFTVFIIGTLYLDILGFILLTIGRRTDKHLLTYRIHLQHICHFVLNRIPMSSFSLRNESGEEKPFDKPSIIISNHQSHIDLMAILSLTPKVIVFTNHWVWNCPFYGWVIRHAGFIPTEDFDYENLDYLKEMVNKGYSIFIFPEGTRSEDRSVLRFHKGAFYLAEQLGLDIQPVMLHGFGYNLPKTNLLLKKGPLNTVIMKKISLKGKEYQNVCKETRKLYVQKYSLLCKEIETADYFADEVINNYLYKGKEIEKRVITALKKHDNYKTEIAMIPPKCNVLLTNCGIGAASLLAALVCKDTIINALIEEEEYYFTALNCASVPNNLHYIRKEENVTYDYIIDCHGE